MSNSKHFGNAYGTLKVKNNGDNGSIYVTVDSQGSHAGVGIEDAPALALAILEAAGIVPAYHSDYQNGTPEALEHVAQGLKDEIDIAESTAKEAADREALTRRRNDLAREFGSSPFGYEDTFDSTKRAIDRIIELEGGPTR